jgi:hypothetical protein
MKGAFIALVIAAAILSPAGRVSAAQRGALREAVRAHGDINRFTISCPPVTGLREVVKFTSLTVEGSITVVESALHEDDRDGMPGAIGPSPFVVDDPLSRAGATATRVRLRVSNQGRVIVDGGSITERSGFPALRVGQHVIVSAYFNRDVGQWVPFGVFEVREGRVIHLDKRLQTLDYDSVGEFATALANPPPTSAR